jgi:hypothetical protein
VNNKKMIDHGFPWNTGKYLLILLFPHSALSEQGAGKGKENCSMSKRSEFLQFPFSGGR